ncbi:Olfactomedin-like protein 2B [Pseudolycoriella hygida]|uniref:Olfactomedin-like protein 2B n=1 Tax=Pseudolycoriella hygida TaxID=35572 RepID=A0A9Q0RY71_9DIPT|nr:Olfactomedin-like protein 2B [Pseudolycoriella hygida]
MTTDLKVKSIHEAPSASRLRIISDNVYVLFIICCLAAIAISAICVWNVRQNNGLAELRQNLKNDLVVEDLRNIIEFVLKDLKNDLTPLNYMRKRDTYAFQRSVDIDRSEDNHITREKRVARIAEGKVIGTTTENQKKYVEFFNPKELEKKDEDFRKIHGLKGAAPGDDEWVWLTSYCRIPYESITGFCRATKEYCPAGPAGVPGSPGPKGNRGDIGLPGMPGRVTRGQKGMNGSPGLDGRDGFPGEPGLDGVPGRAGKDGIPGMPGKDGIPGTPGTNGRNGLDGKMGPVGPPGPAGPPGKMGIAGPRGPSGQSGKNGDPGKPGISAYSVTVNGSSVNELLIPPSITGGNSAELRRPIVVNEGDNVRLRCAASGFPIPNIEWRLRHADSIKTINFGLWQTSSVGGHTLNITKINRVHMGKYQCIADNGIPPPSFATFDIEVHFAPLTFVRNQYLYVTEGGSVTLECETEAFPEPVQYWKRKSENIVLDNGNKYKMGTYNNGMQLNITKVQKDDYGEYLCVSVNSVNTTAAVIYVIDKRKPPNRKFDSIAFYGTERPKLESYEELCGPPPKCIDCKVDRASNCMDTIADLVGNLEIKHTENRSFPLFFPRKLDCVLNAVGKPVYHSENKITFGAWLKDPRPKNDEIGEKIWMTSDSNKTIIYEYKNKEAHRKNKIDKTHVLNTNFQGNAHVVYNGSFYYQGENTDKIVRYDLEQRKELDTTSLYKAAASGSNYLYTTKHNYMDFNVDENGLWVIYATTDSNHTHVAKLNPFTLEAQYNWNISINHHKVGEMFIICGVLYAIDSVVERSTQIRLALDLYENKVLHVNNLNFTNPFNYTTTVGYNYRDQELYTWDGGMQLIYPIRCNDIGYSNSSSKTTDAANSEIKTGYVISSPNRHN